jgi:hypothetical protein
LCAIGGSTSLPTRTIIGLGKNIALHTLMSDINARVRNSAAGSIFSALTRSFVERFFIWTARRGR